MPPLIDLPIADHWIGCPPQGGTYNPLISADNIIPLTFSLLLSILYYSGRGEG